MASSYKYVLITPVRDEERYIEETLRSVTSQTCPPQEWVIVNDGSRDRTGAIIDRFAARYPWIKHVATQRKDGRYPGYPVVVAFNFGAGRLKTRNYDFIVKLDADLRFDEDYFQKMLQKFDENQRMGIASGVYLEKTNDRWIPVRMPEYHTAGACKIIRRKCFEEIGGFVASMGWDTVDEIKALARGWETRHFPEIQFYHLKKEGSGIGLLRTSVLHGKVFYLTGGSSFFFCFKAVKRMLLGRPPLLNGLFMSWGFLKPLLLRQGRLVSKDEADLYNKLLAKRVISRSMG